MASEYGRGKTEAARVGVGGADYGLGKGWEFIV